MPQHQHQHADKITPIKKDGPGHRKSIVKRTEPNQNSGPVNMMQPRILSKTTKNSTHASKEHLLRTSANGVPTGAGGGAQNQGQVLIN